MLFWGFDFAVKKMSINKLAPEKIQDTSLEQDVHYSRNLSGYQDKWLSTTSRSTRPMDLLFIFIAFYIHICFRLVVHI